MERNPGFTEIYALGDLKFRHICYTTLVALFFHDLFPEPEIVCKYLGVYQYEAVQWILSIMLMTIDGAEVDVDTA